MKIKNIVVSLFCLLLLFGNVNICYGDIYVFPPQYKVFLEEVNDLDISVEEYKRMKAEEYGISEKEFNRYLFYEGYKSDFEKFYDWDLFYETRNFREAALDGGFTYEDYLEYKKQDDMKVIFSLVGLVLFVIFWIFIFVKVVKKIKVIKVYRNKENSNELGVEK